MAVYGYSRVSTAMQVQEGESLDVQQRQIEAYCMMHALELTGTFVERGISGSVPASQRPEGGKLWNVLRKGDTVIAAKLDRLFRSALDALKTVEEFRQLGVSLVLIDLGGDVAANGMSKMFMTISAAFAEAERDRIRERITTSKTDQRQRGRYLGGKVPFGYAKSNDGNLAPVPNEQAIIVKAQAMRCDGRTLRAIQASIAQATGRKLSLDAIQRLVAVPVHEGVIVPRLVTLAAEGSWSDKSPQSANNTPMPEIAGVSGVATPYVDHTNWMSAAQSAEVASAPVDPEPATGNP